jgi:biopolymer transport protein ExbD
MPKFKKGRLGIKLDMTPFVDIGFLLLTFFMLTTQFRPAEEVQIILPSSHSSFKLPETDVMHVTISKDNRIFVGFDSQHMQGRIFGDENRLRAGVEVTPRELGDVLIRARMSNPKLRTVVRGDKDADYGITEDVMNILQKANITRFSLVTDMERGDIQ